MDDKTTIALATTFSPEPYGRWPAHGPFNGEKFRHTVLLPAFARSEAVHVDMSGAQLGPSFIEEAFGGLVRFGYLTQQDLKRRLTCYHPVGINEQLVWRSIERAKYGVDKAKRGPIEARYAR